MKCVDSGNATTKALSATAATASPTEKFLGSTNQRVSTEDTRTCVVAKITCQQLLMTSPTIASGTIRIVVMYEKDE
ncbi:hypothetical protein ACFX16_007332 [Malus domestica]